VYVTVAGGEVTLSEVTDRPVDCRISADPVAYLLVGFNRTSQWSAIAKGQLVAWGRKPWLSLTFAKLFDSP
ncbi:MAG: maleylpyruvate isomerase family mycothiol-dependent enzyme, partial [Actinomycetota bacterium]